MSEAEQRRARLNDAEMRAHAEASEHSITRKVQMIQLVDEDEVWVRDGDGWVLIDYRPNP